MVTRNIVEIDEELCDGCGQCIPSCAEKALQIIDGKAKLVEDAYCDGLGACLGVCPKEAINIIQREATPFDEEAVTAYLSERGSPVNSCPSLNVVNTKTAVTTESALRNWPVQLRLVSAKAPFFNESQLLVVADCVPIAYPNLHESLLPGKILVVGCPKFDDARGYVDKMGEILENNNVKSIVVAYMEVPCCSGMNWIVNKAVQASGKNIPVTQRIVNVRGEIQ